MLLRFLLNNWTSYKEDTELSLLATAEKQHAETLSSVKKFDSSSFRLLQYMVPMHQGKVI